MRRHSLVFCFIRPSCTLSNPSVIPSLLFWKTNERMINGWKSTVSRWWMRRCCQTRRQHADVAASIRGTVGQPCSAFDERKKKKTPNLFINSSIFGQSAMSNHPSVHPSILHVWFSPTIFISVGDVNVSQRAGVDLSCAWKIKNFSSPRKTKKKGVWKNQHIKNWTGSYKRSC